MHSHTSWLMGRLLPLSLTLGILLLALSACGSVSAGHRGPLAINETPAPQATSRVQFSAPEGYSLTHPYFATRITFAPGVSFSQALQQVTDLGLQPLYYCDTIQATFTWHPMGEQATFAQSAVLEVSATPDAPSDWLARLNAAASVRALFDGWSGCSSGSVEGTPPCCAFLGNGNYQTYAGAFVQVAFSAGVSYDQALSALSNLGFRLANPCFEQAVTTSAKPPWRSPGQEQAFGTTYVLVVATTTANSTQWQTQLRALPGVKAITQPYQPACAA